MTWPSIQAPSYTMGEVDFLPQMRTEFESGYVQSRVKATQAKMRFSLRWDAMSSGDYADLKAAFRADQGSTFSWTHPETGENYTVRYSGNSLTSTLRVNNLRRVQVDLEEAP